jgi:multiple antibiotic resistance protein
VNLHDYWLHGITVLMGFFAILNPVGNLPVFLGMVHGLDEKSQRQVAFRAVLVAFTIITVFSLFGHFIFQLFGITLPAFQIAGGVIVFVLGYNLLNAKTTMHSQDAIKREDMKQLGEDMAITPLGTPLLAGPGTIAAAMNFVGQDRSIGNAALVVGLFGVMCLFTYLLFAHGRALASRVNPGILTVVTRVMGLILAVIAIQMVIYGIQGAIKLAA